MDFFISKKECINCGKKVGLNRWEIKKDDGCLCPACFKLLGGTKNIDILYQKNSAEIKEILNPKPVVDIPINPQKHIDILPIKNSLTFKVVGVTFKTGRKSRQVMLKNMYFRNTPPFDENINITFERYDYKGQLAIGVYANNLQIGNVPSDLVEEFDSYWVSDYDASFKVYGSDEINWVCSIDVDFY